MQVSAQKINRHIETQLFAALYQVLADTRNPQEVAEVLDSLLSPAERTVVAKRLSIAVFLDKGRSYENIKNTLKVSSATIASVQADMGKPGFQLALQKVKTDQWAEAWSKKLGGVWRDLFPR